jgi:hypothetical protein
MRLYRYMGKRPEVLVRVPPFLPIERATRILVYIPFCGCTLG